MCVHVCVCARDIREKDLADLITSSRRLHSEWVCDSSLRAAASRVQLFFSSSRTHSSNPIKSIEMIIWAQSLPQKLLREVGKTWRLVSPLPRSQTEREVRGLDLEWVFVASSLVASDLSWGGSGPFERASTFVQNVSKVGQDKGWNHHKQRDWPCTCLIFYCQMSCHSSAVPKGRYWQTVLLVT